MKKNLFLITVILLCQTTYAQFPLHTVLPVGVSGIMFGDSILNTSAVLRKAGVRSVYSYLPKAEGARVFSSQTFHLDDNGRVVTAKTCHPNPGNKESAFCMIDTVLFDAEGNMSEYRARDGKGGTYLVTLANYISEKEVQYRFITMDPRNPDPDTAYSYVTFNDQGQPVKRQLLPSRGCGIKATLYYNADGLPDSIRHHNGPWGTFIFQRTNSTKGKELSLESVNASHRWTYNRQGQCISYIREQKGPQGTRVGFDHKGAVYFSYNPDGTLAEVREMSYGRKEVVTVYRYTKGDTARR